MNIFGIFKQNIGIFKQNKSSATATCAKERLKLLVSEQRFRSSVGQSLPYIQQDIAQVLNKYVRVPEEKVNLKLLQRYEQEILELNVVLPFS